MEGTMVVKGISSDKLVDAATPGKSKETFKEHVRPNAPTRKHYDFSSREERFMNITRRAEVIYGPEKGSNVDHLGMLLLDMLEMPFYLTATKEDFDDGNFKFDMVDCYYPLDISHVQDLADQIRTDPNNLMWNMPEFSLNSTSNGGFLRKELYNCVCNQRDVCSNSYTSSASPIKRPSIMSDRRCRSLFSMAHKNALCVAVHNTDKSKEEVMELIRTLFIDHIASRTDERDFISYYTQNCQREEAMKMTDELRRNLNEKGNWFIKSKAKKCICDIMLMTAFLQLGKYQLIGTALNKLKEFVRSLPLGDVSTKGSMRFILDLEVPEHLQASKKRKESNVDPENVPEGASSHNNAPEPPEPECTEVTKKKKKDEKSNDNVAKPIAYCEADLVVSSVASVPVAPVAADLQKQFNDYDRASDTYRKNIIKGGDYRGPKITQGNMASTKVTQSADEWSKQSIFKFDIIVTLVRDMCNRYGARLDTSLSAGERNKRAVRAAALLGFIPHEDKDNSFARMQVLTKKWVPYLQWRSFVDHMWGVETLLGKSGSHNTVKKNYAIAMGIANSSPSNQSSVMKKVVMEITDGRFWHRMSLNT